MAKPSGQPLKIGFVLDGGLEEPYGIQQYILTLGEFYKYLGHSVRYLVPGRINYGKLDSLPLSRKLKQVLHSEQFDVLHVQVPYLPFFGERLIYQAGPQTAIVGSFHGVPRSWIVGVANWLLGKWSYFSLKRFNYLVSVSPAAQRTALSDFNLTTEVLPNVIAYERFKSAKPIKHKDKTLTILFLGRLIERKGALELLKAVKLLAGKPDVPKFRVVIGGKGPLLPKLQDYANKHGISGIVEFSGFVSENVKPRYFASADISVFPALGGESFGVVLLEAMASGKSAVLAADNEGYSSVLKDYPEQLFKRRDPVLLASKIEELLKNEPKRRRLAKAGSDYAATFDVKLVGNKLINIYEEALLKKRG